MIVRDYEICIWCHNKAEYSVSLHGTFTTYWCYEDLPFKGHKPDDKVQVIKLEKETS